MIGRGGGWWYSSGGRFGVDGARNGKTSGSIGLERCDSLYEDSGEGLLRYTSGRPKGAKKCVPTFLPCLSVEIAVLAGVLFQHVYEGTIGFESHS